MPYFIKVPWLHVSAITLWFIVLYVGEILDKTKLHETIHFKQYNELFVIGFLAVYFWDWFWGILKTRSLWGGYFIIRLEQEAYIGSKDEDYLKNRNKYAWTSFKV